MTDLTASASQTTKPARKKRAPFHINTVAGRERLAPASEPYFTSLSKGLSLGFRKTGSVGEDRGTWIARRTEQRRKTPHALGAFGGKTAFDEARKSAELWAGKVAAGINAAPLTVADACTSYVSGLKSAGRIDAAKDAQGRFNAHVFKDRIGKIRLDKLTSVAVKKWRDGLLTTCERSGANRHLATLKAVLNQARRDRLVQSDDAWVVVPKFENADRRRDVLLTADQMDALVTHAKPAAGAFFRACILTGMRPGEVAALQVRDFDAKAGTLRLRKSKVKGNELALVPVGMEAAEQLRGLCVGRIGAAALVPAPRGGAWDKKRWGDAFRAAATAAGLPAAAVTYSLRHAWITGRLAAGMNVVSVARAAGTSVEMIDRNYAQTQVDALRAELEVAEAKLKASGRK